MSAIMRDANAEAAGALAAGRLLGGPLDEVLYAGDTFLLSARTAGLQVYLRAIEKVYGWYGLLRYYQKCAFDDGSAEVPIVYGRPDDRPR